MKQIITILKISVFYFLIALNYCFGQEKNDSLIDIIRLTHDSINVYYDKNENFINYLVKEVKYPQIAYENGVEGEVNVIFGLDSLGFINYLFFESSSNRLLKKEVIPLASPNEKIKR